MKLILDYFMTKIIPKQEIFDSADKVVNLEILVSNNYDPVIVKKFRDIYDMIRKNKLETLRDIGVKSRRYNYLEAPDAVLYEIEEQEYFALSLGFLKQ